MSGETRDFITILKCASNLRMTKTWRLDGSIAPYDTAKHFRVGARQVANLMELKPLLEKLAGEPRCCVIRGAFIGEERAAALAAPEKAHYFPRNNDLFEERPHHLITIDIDSFMPKGRPGGPAPAVDPEPAIEEYITTQLPGCFHGVDYLWQLSASAGAPGKEHVLKAHLWFWLSRSYTGPQLTAWVRGGNLNIDVSIFRRVQPNYTAAPVFEEGLQDPVPVRLGFVEGWVSSQVDLEIDPAVLEQARDFESDVLGGIELVDPTQKPGLIGAFCRAYSIEEVVNEWLPEVFESQDGSDRRLNHLVAGGAPGGAFVSDCREYITSMHNTDPMQNRATNKWDLVRHYKFGHLDEGKDAFELMDVSARPSHLAMLEFASGLEPVRAIAAEAKREVSGEWRTKIADALDQVHLQEICVEISEDRGLNNIARHELAGLVQERFRALGVRLPITEVRNQVGLGRQHRPEIAMEAPDWARSWCWCTDGDWFFNLMTKEKVTERSFNAMHTRFMGHLADPDTGLIPAASSFCLNEWRLQTVSHLAYMPQTGPVFEMNGYLWGNLYRPGSVPGVDLDYKKPGTAAYDAVEILKAHLRRFIPNRRERRIFTSWLAQNVQHPGVKIRWAPYVQGFEGDGKSFFADLLAAVMGPINLRTVSGATIESSGFTDWAIGYAVAVIEEMKLQGHNRYDVANKLKPFITNSQVEIHPKGKASYSAPNCTNYLVLSNYLDGAPVSEADRRYFFLSGAIQFAELRQLTQDGYFKRLFDTLEQHPQALRAWLLDFELDVEFDADGRAPESEARASAIELSRSDTESAARDIIEEGAEGVCRRIVSSAHLSVAVRAKLGADAELGTHKVTGLLSRLGYRFLGRHWWKGEARKIWIFGEPLMWSEAKALLDATVGKEFKNHDEQP